jgi:hypothetical protein|tara:strand:+ start:306 stop:671 length:366 start_codon:yes stop_codon:yes gene_type:complete
MKMKLNSDKIAKIYLSIIGGSAVTHSTYNMYNAPIEYKQNCIDTYKYKNYKYDSNIEKPTFNTYIDKPSIFGITIYVIEALGIGFFKGIWMGALFPITIPSSIYYMTVKYDLAELEKVEPS